MTGNTLAGMSLFLDVRVFFLKTGVIDANFKQFGNFALFKESLKYFAIYAAKKLLLSFKSFTGRSASCIAFEVLRILISFSTSASVNWCLDNCPRRKLFLG